MGNPFDLDAPAGPDLRSEKQIKDDWMEHNIEYKNPALQKKTKKFNFPPPTPEELERMKNLDMYGNPRKVEPPGDDTP